MSLEVSNSTQNRVLEGEAPPAKRQKTEPSSSSSSSAAAGTLQTRSASVYRSALQEHIGAVLLTDLINIVDDYLKEPIALLFVKTLFLDSIKDESVRDSITKEALQHGKEVTTIDLNRFILNIETGSLENQKHLTQTIDARVEAALKFFPTVSKIISFASTFFIIHNQCTSDYKELHWLETSQQKGVSISSSPYKGSIIFHSGQNLNNDITPETPTYTCHLNFSPSSFPKEKQFRFLISKSSSQMNKETVFETAVKIPEKTKVEEGKAPHHQD